MLTMNASVWNLECVPLQDGVLGWSLGSHTMIFPHYISHKNSVPAPSHATELGFNSQLTLIPPVVQGRAPKSMPFQGWGGHFLLPTHENLFGSQVFCFVLFSFRTTFWLPLTHESR